MTGEEVQSVRVMWTHLQSVISQLSTEEKAFVEITNYKITVVVTTILL